MLINLQRQEQMPPGAPSPPRPAAWWQLGPPGPRFSTNRRGRPGKLLPASDDETRPHPPSRSVRSGARAQPSRARLVPR